VKLQNYFLFKETLPNRIYPIKFYFIKKCTSLGSGLTFGYSLSFVLSKSRVLIQIWYSDPILILDEGNFKRQIFLEIRAKAVVRSQIRT